ncbi:MAG: hypothetical protein DME33_12295 [Verrucomicrobia bacterium]|nr:MAG: hypothetical protein DME33_12295 [Verrucomicrobiota bacterium]
MPTLQTRASAAARAVVDVPGASAIAAARHTNAQAKASELIIVFVNFVFIVVVSFCLSFLLFWPSLTLRHCEIISGRSSMYCGKFGPGL